LSSVKSPFLVIEETISPQRCEGIVSEYALVKPSMSIDGEPLAYERYLTKNSEVLLQEVFSQYGELIAEKYGSSIENIFPKFQQFWENVKSPAQQIALPGWKYARKKWTKTADVDLIAIIWMKDFNSSVPLDPRFETYGGKVEFPSFDFSFVPVRGTMIIFPAVPNFAYALSHVLYGSMEQIICGIKLNNSLEYKAENFPGTYRDWF